MKKILNIVYFFTIGAMVCLCDGGVSEKLDLDFNKAVVDLRESNDIGAFENSINEIRENMGLLERVVGCPRELDCWEVLWRRDVKIVRCAWKVLQGLQDKANGKLKTEAVQELETNVQELKTQPSLRETVQNFVNSVLQGV